MRSLSLLLILGCVSFSVMSAPTFTDQKTEAGYLNPADAGIIVQTIRVVGDATYNATLNAVQIRNQNGTADYHQITRIEIHDGGAAICVIDTPVGLSAVNGVTISGTHTISKGDTEDLTVRIWVGDVDAVDGGETVQLEVRFHYLVNGTAGTSAWIADGKAEEIRSAGLEVITDTSPLANNFNPGDESNVQVVSFQDRDANESGLTLKTVTVRNAGTATGDDIASLKVTLAYTGGPWEETKTGTELATWKDGGVVFNPPDIAIGDEGAVTVTIVAKVAGPTATVPVDNRSIRSQVDLEIVENAQTYHQVELAATTQKIRRGGIETIVDDSAIPASGVLNSGEALVQKIIVKDEDINDDRVNIKRIWVRNLGTAQASEIVEIRVKSGGVSKGTFSGAQIADFLTGVWLDITDVLVANNGEGTFVIEYETASSHTLRPQVKVEGDEDGNVYTSAAADYPVAVTLYLAGFEIVENQALATGTVYSFLRFCAQKVLLRDIDENRYSVTINPVVVRNRGTATDTEIAKIEIRTAAGDLLGETSTVGGLSAGGIAVSTLRNNVVTDNGEVTLWVWITLAGPEQTVAGHTLQLETTVFHSEAGVSYERTVQGTSFTSAVNHRPVPNFTFAAATTAGASIGPKADFTHDQTIQFTATATDPDADAIASWAWNFGDETASSVQNPTHAYPNGGTFTITLTVTDARGATGSVSKAITVAGPPNVAPTVDFTWSPQNPAEGVTVTFTATVTDSDQPTGTAFTYAWDFGETPTSTAAAPTHAFTEKKTYTVTLTVTDARQGKTTVSKTISVGNEKPVAAFTVSTTTPSTGDPVQFTDTSTDPNDDPADTPFTYAWNFGDGTTSTAQNPSHTYTIAATRTVTLIVTDSRGAVSEAKTALITVTGPAKIVLYGFPNPAATTATIKYFLPTGATAPELSIFDLRGRRVLRQALAAAGTEFAWNLQDEAGDAVANGLYFCMITATSATDRSITSEVFRLLVAR